MNGKTILITGGTGSLGQALAVHFLQSKAQKVIIFSRNEHKQVQMREFIPDKRLRFFIGDVRDRSRLNRAFRGVDVVIHCAALKHVPVVHYNPREAVLTNVNGTQNVVDAAIDCGVKKLLAVSSDKAIYPVNSYGASKLLADHLVIQGMAYAAGTETRMSVIRFGNFIGSSGSVIPKFKRLKEEGKSLPVTDYRMTRYFIGMGRACELVSRALDIMKGGEIFTPHMAAIKIYDIAKAMKPVDIVECGIRPGEKIHEDLLAKEDAPNTERTEDFLITREAYLGGIQCENGENSERAESWWNPERLIELS